MPKKTLTHATHVYNWSDLCRFSNDPFCNTTKKAPKDSLPPQIPPQKKKGKKRFPCKLDHSKKGFRFVHSSWINPRVILPPNPSPRLDASPWRRPWPARRGRRSPWSPRRPPPAPQVDRLGLGALAGAVGGALGGRGGDFWRFGLKDLGKKAGCCSGFGGADLKKGGWIPESLVEENLGGASLK